MIGLGLGLASTAVRGEAPVWLLGAPSFSLNLLSQAIQGAFGTLDPRVSFSRGSLATVTRSDGVTGWAGHNLLPNSETGDVNIWDRDGATLTENLPGVPGQTAASFSFSKTTPGSHYVRTRFINAPAGSTVTCRAWLWIDAGTLTNVQPTYYNGSAWVNVGAPLAVTSTPQQFTWTYTTATATTLGSIFTLLLTYPAGTNSLRVSGAQANMGSTAHPYYPTTGTAYHAPRFQFDPSTVQVVENYGPECLPDPSFDAPGSWVLNQPTAGSVAISGGNLTINTTDGSFCSAEPAGGNTVFAGRTYRIDIEVTSASGGGVRVDLAGFSTPARTAPGTYTVFAVAQTTGKPGVVRGAGVSSATVARVSVREYLGLINPATPNLVTNGDFSNGLNGWSQINTAGGTTTAVNGVATLSTPAPGDIARLRQSLATTPGRAYVVTVGSFTATTPSGALSFGTTGGGIQYFFLGPLNNGSTTQVIVATDTTMWISAFVGDSGGSVTFDNISVREISTDASLYGANLVSNGTFDTDATGWTVSGAGVLSVVDGRLRCANGSASKEGASQNVTTVANRAYAYTQFVDVGNGSSGVIVRARNGGTVLASQTVTVSGTYTLFFVAASATTNIQTVTDTAGAGFFHEIDNVQVREYLGDRQGSVATPLGLLVEEQRSNRLLWSEDFSQTVWVKTNVAVSPNSAVAPDGNPTADTLTATAANGTVLQTITPGAGAQNQSMYLRRRTGTGAIELTADGSTWTAVNINSTTWTRVDVTHTAPAGAINVGIRIAVAGDAVDAWGAQHE